MRKPEAANPPSARTPAASSKEPPISGLKREPPISSTAERAAPLPVERQTSRTAQAQGGQRTVSGQHAPPAGDSSRSDLTVQVPQAEAKPPAVAPSLPNEKPSGIKASDGFEKVPLLRDDRLKVQAIAWSSKADDRMAVVNSHVIHEGDALDDFVVVAIRPDDVVVREKENGLWRVVFGRP